MKSINELVHGHEKAKKVLSVLLARSAARYYNRIVLEVEDESEPLKCLLIGQSGTGKTHLVHSLRKLHDFPLLCVDATQLMPTGNDTGINSKQLAKLINDKAAAELLRSKEAHDGRYHSIKGVLNQLVIFVDEFDKLGTSFDSSGNWNKHVQANFLTMIDNKEEFSDVSWIFAGAFSELYAKKSNGIGFSNHGSAESSEITDEHILRSGIIPELVGRISLIVQLDTLTESDFMQVLNDRLLPKYPTLHLSELEKISIIRKASASEQGIRSLTRQLEMLSIEEEYDIFNKITITLGV